MEADIETVNEGVVVVESEPEPELPPQQLPIVMGDVQQAGMGAAMGSIEPKVVFNAEALPEPPWGPDDEVIAALERRRAALTARVDKLEDLIGFVRGAGDLAVRVAKLERFLGVIGAKV